MSLPGKPRIRFDRAAKVFTMRSGQVTALDGLEFTVADGSFCCVVGPSGCGKSTILRVMAGLDSVTSGSVSVHQSDATRPLTSMVFQEQQSVLPWLSVADNVDYGMKMRGVPKRERDATVAAWIQRVGLSGFEARYPHQLSGGMRQRVNIARAFANNPEILLMDEPFASLDYQNRTILQEELLSLWESDSKTVVYVTHDIEEALMLGDQLVVLTARPARVKTVIPIPFPRPRDISSLRLNPDFHALAHQVRELIREEVTR